MPENDVDFAQFIVEVSVSSYSVFEKHLVSNEPHFRVNNFVFFSTPPLMFLYTFFMNLNLRYFPWSRVLLCLGTLASLISRPNVLILCCFLMGLCCVKRCRPDSSYLLRHLLRIQKKNVCCVKRCRLDSSCLLRNLLQELFFTSKPSFLEITTTWIPLTKLCSLNFNLLAPFTTFWSPGPAHPPGSQQIAQQIAQQIWAI